MKEIQLIVIFPRFPSFKLGAEEKRIFYSGVNQVEILNSIHAKVSFFHLQKGVVQWVLIVYLKA